MINSIADAALEFDRTCVKIKGDSLRDSFARAYFLGRAIVLRSNLGILDTGAW
ncbi:hypothetical protein [Microcoleus sp. EPA2]|uniref:hypothetical protein n=1 Tax=Microcoleus sp. EPA2 TaxID=2841654 RepID=UPI00312B74B5